MGNKREITVPKINAHTAIGAFTVRAARKELVQIGGLFRYGNKEFPFSLTLKKTRGGWTAIQIGVEQFNAFVIEAFSKWAVAHPHLLTMAGRIQEHNHAENLSSKVKKSVTKSSG